MSARNDEGARFQKDRKRTLPDRRRIRELPRTLGESAVEPADRKRTAGEQDNSQGVTL